MCPLPGNVLVEEILSTGIVGGAGKILSHFVMSIFYFAIRNNGYH